MNNLNRLLLTGAIGGTYHSFVQYAIAKGYSVTALLQNPTFLGSIKIPPRMSYPRDFPTLKVESPENYDTEMIDKKAVIVMLSFLKDVIDPNEYFELIEQLVPSMMAYYFYFFLIINRRNVKKLIIAAADGEMIDETLKSISDYLSPIKLIDKTIIKYNRNKHLGLKIDLKPQDYEGHLEIYPGFNYKISNNDQGYMKPCHIAPIILDAIENTPKNQIMSICRAARFTPD